ncbi:imidazole glycerol phosphate synthase subunit HisH [Flavobacteriaceae bacterium]|nr:imidazole glycerol phosphate synthase subunit HisH [Flavobacteriaceae bacterium]
MKTVIIDYGAGNVKSLQFALERLGVAALLTKVPEEILAADKIIFPGQGEAKSAMAKLKENELDLLLKDLKQPVLGICLGMQLFCSHSQEGDTEGLGIVSSEVVRFPITVKVPQMGWNLVQHNQEGLFEGISKESYMYLVHSYYVPLINETIARSEYSTLYSVAIQKDNFYGVQFHPEKSGKPGNRLLENFLKL